MHFVRIAWRTCTMTTMKLPGHTAVGNVSDRIDGQFMDFVSELFPMKKASRNLDKKDQKPCEENQVEPIFPIEKKTTLP